MLKFSFSLLLIFLITSPNWASELSFDSLNSFYETKSRYYQNSSVNEEELLKKTQEFKEGLLFEESIDQEALGRLLIYVAQAKAIERYDLAISLLNSGISLSPPISLIKGFLYHVKGGIKRIEKKVVEALENHLKASLVFEQNKEDVGMAYTYFQIALINFDGQNNTIALKYADQSLINFQKQKSYSRLDSFNIATLFNLKGVVNRRMMQYDSAILNIDKSISITRLMGDSLRVAIASGNKAVVFYEKGDLDSAEPLLLKDFNASLSNNVYGSAFNAGVILGNIYMEQEKIGQLDSLFRQLINLKQTKQLYISKSALLPFYQLATKVYEIKDEDSLTSVYEAKAFETRQYLDSAKKANDFDHLQEKYLMEKEVAKLELLKKTNELQNTHLKLRTTLLIIIAFALIVVLWYVYVLMQKNKKIDKLNELLEVKVSERTNRLMEINKELDNYLYRASHDIRRPIRTLLGLNNVVKFTEDPQELKGLFDKVYDTAINMDEMLFKLQMAYELNNTHEIEDVNIYSLVKNSIKDMDRQISLKNASINIEENVSAMKLKANHVLLKIAIDNILENALIYHNVEKPEIKITTDLGKYYFYIHIQDNGYGIDPAYSQKIFDAYFKISNKTQGSGLGLFLAQKAMSFLAGDIIVESVINAGSKFTIKIPINPK